LDCLPRSFGRVRCFVAFSRTIVVALRVVPFAAAFALRHCLFTLRSRVAFVVLLRSRCGTFVAALSVRFVVCSVPRFGSVNAVVALFPLRYCSVIRCSAGVVLRLLPAFVVLRCCCDCARALFLVDVYGVDVRVCCYYVVTVLLRVDVVPFVDDVEFDTVVIRCSCLFHMLVPLFVALIVVVRCCYLLFVVYCCC